MALRDAVVVGGLDMQAQARELARRPHIVAATPGRLAALLREDAGLARAFARTKFLVLDEADRLLEPSFEPELAVVLNVLPQARAAAAALRPVAPALLLLLLLTPPPPPLRMLLLCRSVRRCSSRPR